MLVSVNLLSTCAKGMKTTNIASIIDYARLGAKRGTVIGWEGWFAWGGRGNFNEI